MDERTMRRVLTRYRVISVGGAAAATAAALWLIAIAPAAFSFALAVLAALWWCYWLERHPERRQARPEPSPDGGSRVVTRQRSLADVGRAA